MTLWFLGEFLIPLFAIFSFLALLVKFLRWLFGPRIRRSHFIFDPRFSRSTARRKWL